MADDKKPEAKEAVPADANVQTEPPKKKKKIILFGGIGAALMVVGGGAFVLMKPKAQTTVSAPDGNAEKTEETHAPSVKEDSKKNDPADETKPNDKDIKKEGAAATSTPQKSTEKTSSKYPDSFAIPKQDINLGNPIEGRYLRVALALEYSGGEAQAEDLKRRQAQFTDILITSASHKTRLELLSETGKNKFKRELKNKFNEVVEQPISAVYFTEFVIE